MIEGPDRYEGNVQLLHNGEWGYVCDDEWDYADAKVACDQLDQRGVDAVRLNSHYGTQSGTIWMNNMKCNGTENTLQECQNSGWGKTKNCTISDKAGAMCTKGKFWRVEDHCHASMQFWSNCGTKIYLFNIIIFYYYYWFGNLLVCQGGE